MASSDGIGDGGEGGKIIKTEPVDEPSGWMVGDREFINLISDDEDNEVNDRDPFVRRLGSPFKAKQQSKAGTDGVDSTVRAEQQGKSGADGVDLGPSLLQTAAPKPTKAARAEILEKQRALLRVKFMEKKTGSDEATEGEQSGETGKNGMMEQQETEGVRPTKRPEQATNDPDDEDENDLFVNGTAPIDHAKLFRDLERLVSRKRKAGTLTDEDDIEFMRAEAAEQERLNKEIADKKAGIPRNKTPGEAAGTAGEDSEGNFVAPPLEDEAAQAEPVAGKKRGRKSATSREEAAQPKKPRKRARVTDPADDADPDGAATAPGRKKAPKGKARKDKAPKGRKKKQGPEMTNTANLTGTDVFRDTEQTRNLPDQPTFAGTGVRTEALKQMVASLPAESVKLANVDMRFLKAAIKSFTGNQTVHPAADGNWSVKGMETTLKHYQVLGVAFMRKREMSQKAPQGGILADSMGLGKTLMMLANIMNGRLLQEKACKTTLIVAAPALVAQWAREIDKHVTKAEKSEKHGLDRVQRFHAGIKLGVNNVKKTLEGADIVLTTYSAVCKSYPKVDVPVDCVTAQQKNDWWKEHYEKNRGVLHQIKFHRVVLDEAQAIKNHMSITSRACRAIEATHHWAISGTPIMNNVKEFYPYFKFLREPTTESFKLFRSNFCSPEDPDGAEKLSVFLGKIMIRRTHMDKLFDAKLLNLPQPEQCIMRLDFNQVERAIYAMVEARYIAKVNQMSQDEELSSQYSHIWTMATRLRQICGHMSLAQGTIMDLMEREDYEKLESLARNEKNISKDCASLLEHLRHRLHVKSLSGSTDERQIDAHLGDAVITEMETAPIHLQSTEGMPQTKDRGQHGDTYHIGRYLDEYRTTASFAEAVERAVCQYCHQRPFDPHVTSCHHIYCFDCLTDMQHKAAARGAESSTCLACGQDYSEVNRCEESMYEPRAAHQSNADSQEGLEFGPGGVKNTKKKVLKVQTWLNMNGEVLPSAKTLAVKVQIEHWKKVDKDVKIIVYTQFLDMVQILKRICSTEGWETCRYTGDMSHDAREKVIAEFGSPGTSKKILLASLRCGGLGLNLTMASRVITLDPWWNASVEQQAFCRVFRIGQLKETQMTRLVVKDTIDEKIMRMQESKQKAIDEVMEDRNGKEKLSIQELMQLFGDVGKKDGKAFIFAQGRDKGETAGESGKCVDPTEEDEDGHLGEEE